MATQKEQLERIELQIALIEAGEVEKLKEILERQRDELRK